MIHTSSSAAKILLVTGIGAALMLMGLMNKYGPKEGTHQQQFDSFKTWPPQGPEPDKALYYAALKLDFIFLLVYPTTLSLACRMTAQATSASGFWYTTGRFLSILILSAIVVDIVDNTTLILFLNNKAGRGLLVFGGLCALWDIGLFVTCSLFSVAGLLRYCLVARSAN
jgi:hypothetical protein